MAYQEKQLSFTDIEDTKHSKRIKQLNLRQDTLKKIFKNLSRCNSLGSFACELERDVQSCEDRKTEESLSVKYHKADPEKQRMQCHEIDEDNIMLMEHFLCNICHSAGVVCESKPCFIDYLIKKYGYKYAYEHGFEPWFRNANDRKIFLKSLKNDPEAICYEYDLDSLDK